MSEAVDGDSRGEVEVFLALGVPHLTTQAVGEHRSVTASVRAQDALVLILAHRVGVNRAVGGDGLGPDGDRNAASGHARTAEAGSRERSVFRESQE